MDELTQTVAAVTSWGQVGATGLVVLAVIAIYRGLLTPKGLIRREDAAAAVDEIRSQTAARVADAQARMAEWRERAEKAEGREEKWRDAWLVSESGRRLAAEQAVDVLRGMTPVAQALTSQDAIRGVDLTPPPP